MPAIGKHPDGANHVITLLKEAAEGTVAAPAYIRKVERAKYRPGQIVDMMQAEGYRRFKRQQHTELWQFEKAKDPRRGFGSPVFGKEGWGWNEKWVTHVRDH